VCKLCCRKYKADIFPAFRHAKYGAPMTVLQLLVGVPILYLQLKQTLLKD
jgi:hypothetical protein